MQEFHLARLGQRGGGRFWVDLLRIWPRSVPKAKQRVLVAGPAGAPGWPLAPGSPAPSEAGS